MHSVTAASTKMNLNDLQAAHERAAKMMSELSAETDISEADRLTLQDFYNDLEQRQTRLGQNDAILKDGVENETLQGLDKSQVLAFATFLSSLDMSDGPTRLLVEGNTHVTTALGNIKKGGKFLEHAPMKQILDAYERIQSLEDNLKAAGSPVSLVNAVIYLSEATAFADMVKMLIDSLGTLMSELVRWEWSKGVNSGRGIYFQKLADPEQPRLSDGEDLSPRHLNFSSAARSYVQERKAKDLETVDPQMVNPLWVPEMITWILDNGSAHFRKDCVFWKGACVRQSIEIEPREEGNKENNGRVTADSVSSALRVDAANRSIRRLCGQEYGNDGVHFLKASVMGEGSVSVGELRTKPKKMIEWRW
ncbi:hypothetical protein C8R43DRAFT_954768 [Mycena crocata]|nr:hypothetical protein C8R43DRAFT_954768 [Mycena crocata]